MGIRKINTTLKTYKIWVFPISLLFDKQATKLYVFEGLITIDTIHIN